MLLTGATDEGGDGDRITPEIAASAKIARGMPKVTATITELRVFGSIWERTTRQGLAPTARAAIT